MAIVVTIGSLHLWRDRQWAALHEGVGESLVRWALGVALWDWTGSSQWPLGHHTRGGHMAGVASGQ
jgi:hypothetical protein